MSETPHTSPIAFAGRGADMARLAVVNALLSLATLGIYRFWARTRIRAYLWGRTEVLDDPVEYTGTGKELFKGFAVVFVVVLLPLWGALAYVNALEVANDPAARPLAAAINAVVMVLAGAGLYRARRYQLTRTVWRGIRGGLDGHAGTYGLRFLGTLLVTAVTLGLAWPWAEMGLARYRLDNTRFGDTRFVCEARSRPVYGWFLALWATAPVALLLAALAQSAHPWGGAAVVIAAAPVALILYARYRAAQLSALAAGTRFAGARFALRATSGQVLALGAKRLAVTVLSLGILHPLATQMGWRFACDNLRLDGEPDMDAVRQSHQDIPKRGEGLASLLDSVGEV